MAKRKRNNSTEEKIDKWIKEGRGQGEGGDYKPWLRVQDVASHGYATRDKGWKTGRIHHFLSDLELNYLYTLDWSSYVVDIREQYPLLPLEKTIAIADEIGVNHPKEDGSHGPYKVITSDFYIICKTEKGEKVCVRTIKPVDNLNVRELEKFDIEKRYFEDIGITDWKLVIDQELPNNFIKNMKWIYDCKYLDNRPNINLQLVNSISPVLYKVIKMESIGLSTLALQYDEKMGLENGTCLFIIKYLLANKIWKTNMNEVINPSMPLQIEDIELQVNKLLG
ncbi:heteromeric transposase endonuclease subunit TnsA [Jeotgalibacillus campisalis]|uniref:Tn7 transposition protein A n=1 Tax=Jeotgalibacillus campisalis TaxID=220754 RepID=A0A0C2SCT3_9BACL|nr:heteromeric transposase endonuclease subunit TnsA [Jeotgalibacillus campisalis]KIL51779.1 hypothetical protein KR50_06980 [Jeotgalibacillus campisalis]